MNNRQALPALTIGAIGVVYGDIGTSPIYAIKEIFNGHHPIPVTPDNVMGMLSIVFWAIMLVVSIKYVAVVMRADNKGEGGSLALLAMMTERTQALGLTGIVTMLGIFAAGLFFGDSMITPAISVLSAVEGLEIVTPKFTPFVMPIALVILTGLFVIQKHGTSKVGMFFGPVMILWFSVLGLLGIVQIAQDPQILLALNPYYALKFATVYPTLTFFALSAVVLAVTGGEALYTDMGHFGRRPIRLAWFGFVLPALVLNYFGQGALLLSDKSAIDSPFFKMAPEWALIPMVVLSTLAAFIASQAVISGAFSVSRQAIQMGLLPRMLIIHTSGEEKGQIYVPFTNWVLFACVIALVLGFKTSSNLASVYGIAVTGTMLIDTILIAFVMRLIWKWSWFTTAIVAGFLFVVDGAFFAANAIKIPEGGWFPLGIGLITFVVLTTWLRGRKVLGAEVAKQSMPMDLFIQAIDDVHRVRGTAIFMTSSIKGVPTALLHNLKHNQILHERVVLMTVHTADTPFVKADQRLTYEDLGKGFSRIVVRYGFMENPDVPKALTLCEKFGQTFDMMSTTFYLSRETVVPSGKRSVWAMRAQLFRIMSKNATSATDFFKIPANRVVELGTQLVI
jgi:KUP system potassium uptake protein